MKKSFALILTILVAGTLCFNACGPSAKEIEAEKKRVQDSIAAAEAAMAAELERQADSIEAAVAKAKADSLEQALEEAKEAAKPKPKPKPKMNTSPETTQPGVGRG